jgi:hypothetical protein
VNSPERIGHARAGNEVESDTVLIVQVFLKMQEHFLISFGCIFPTIDEKTQLLLYFLSGS